MTIEENNIQLSDDIEIIGPGQILKEARIESGLSLETVAEHLNLRLSLIENIEAEQFDPKVPKTFMRGYLKNYARLLGINYDDIQSSYEALDDAYRQGNEMKSFSQSTKLKAENNLLMLAVYGFVIVLIALTVVWWLQNSDNDKKEINLIEPLVETTPAELKPNEQLNSDILKSADTSSPLNANELNQVDVNSEKSLDTMSTENSTVVAAVSSDLEYVETSVSPQTSNDNANIALADLVFTFNGDCWVNISDASGERLAYGVKKADYVMTLQGTPPFTITLGKPELVEMAYNQKTLDMEQFQKGQIAKFTWPKN